MLLSFVWFSGKERIRHLPELTNQLNLEREMECVSLEERTEVLKCRSMLTTFFKFEVINIIIAGFPVL